MLPYTWYRQTECLGPVGATPLYLSTPVNAKLWQQLSKVWDQARLRISFSFHLIMLQVPTTCKALNQVLRVIERVRPSSHLGIGWSSYSQTSSCTWVIWSTCWNCFLGLKNLHAYWIPQQCWCWRSRDTRCEKPHDCFWGQGKLPLLLAYLIVTKNLARKPFPSTCTANILESVIGKIKNYNNDHYQHLVFLTCQAVITGSGSQAFCSIDPCQTQLGWCYLHCFRWSN